MHLWLNGAMSRKITLSFLEHFCRGDIDALAPLLAPDLKFSGPFHTFGSAEAYITSLRNDPPEPCEYELLSLTESGDEVVMVYDYIKPAQTIRIAQRCTIKEKQIVRISLNFDTAVFEGSFT